MIESASVHYPGRLCLVGEHCDWAGGTSLAVPLGQSIRVKAVGQTGGTRVSARSLLEGSELTGSWDRSGGVNRTGGPLRFIPAALHLLDAAGIRLPPATLEVTSDLPPARGFSSSAAFTLGVLDALARLAGTTFPVERLAQMAFEVENTLLGVECGLLDQLSCAHRVPVSIRWDEAYPDGYRLTRIAPAGVFHFLVGSFSKPRDTRAILAALNRDRRAGGAPTGRAFATFADAAESATSALASGDAPALGTEMDRAQAAYEELLEAAFPELAAPLLRRACRRARELGALGAKFSGAGGDGSVVALFASESAARQASTALEAEFALEASVLRLGSPT